MIPGLDEHRARMEALRVDMGEPNARRPAQPRRRDPLFTDRSPNVFTVDIEKLRRHYSAIIQYLTDDAKLTGTPYHFTIEWGRQGMTGRLHFGKISTKLQFERFYNTLKD